jgi:hypothetical protein
MLKEFYPTKVKKQNEKSNLKMLDCFCGMGGVSDGFALEGFDVTGIDIVDAPKMLGYKHRFIQADMLTLNGEAFRGYDVIWGSPPCREWSLFAKRFGKTFKKNPPNPQKGLELVKAFLKFVEDAKPKIWILENVPYLEDYLHGKPRFISTLRVSKYCKNPQMRRAFWGNFPDFLLPKEDSPYVMRIRAEVKARHQVYPTFKNSAERAKIPLACSRAFATACREKLLEMQQIA